MMTSISDIIPTIVCTKCGHMADIRREDVKPPHIAQAWCPHCESHVRWVGSGKSKRSTKGHARLLLEYSNGYCEMCQRDAGEIPRPGCLTVHHKVEVQNGGSDERENIWVLCSACHGYVHHIRTYFGHYGDVL